MHGENGFSAQPLDTKCLIKASKEGPKKPVTNGNPVRRLEEYASEKLWPPLSYDFMVFENGDQKKYSCCISCSKFPHKVVKGSGRCRRAARRNAASSFLKLLSEPSEEELLTPPVNIHNNGSLKDFNNNCTCSQTDIVELSKFLRGLKLKTGKTLACIQLMDLGDKEGNFCQLLQEVAEEQDFEVVYKNCVQKTPQGKYLSELHITRHLLTFSGTGATTTQAQKMAAYAALQYLKKATRK